ncbi:MAG: DUF116 domain-containing protein [Candidatus Thorarchaeota archaeon]
MTEETTSNETIFSSKFEIIRATIREILKDLLKKEQSITSVELAKMAVAKLLYGDEDLINFIHIESMNVLCLDKYQNISMDEKILLIPHCLRNADKCIAPVDTDGYHCKKCGACIISEIVTLADERGIKWYIAGGGSQAMRLIKKIRPKGVIGIACYDEALMALTKLVEYDIPTQAILLSQDGCVNTQVDIGVVRRVLESDHDAD